MIRNSRIDLTLNQPDEWSPEKSEAALERSPEIGRTFFERLGQLYPRVAERLIFLRWREQAGDVYAVYDAEPGFGVQIDPDMDYIIVWDGVTQGEYAQWRPEDDPIAAALAHISGALGLADG